MSTIVEPAGSPLGDAHRSPPLPGAPRWRIARLWLPLAAILLSLASGCAEAKRGPIVFYLDGAGWLSGAGPVESGLRAAGYRGIFENFAWSAFLGPAHDHIVTARSGLVARRLARRIAAARQHDPERQIDVMGLSAGTAVVLAALEALPKDVAVDNVVLFSSSASAHHDLTKAMSHVTGHLYATCSPSDGILPGLLVNADGIAGRAAGISGFVMPRRRGKSTTRAYQRVVNLIWNPTYIGLGWNGGHASATGREFVQKAIAPRLRSPEQFPLDRAVAERPRARSGIAS